MIKPEDAAGSIYRNPPRGSREFKATTIKLCEIAHGSFGLPSIDYGADHIVQVALNEGWRISETIICPPLVMVIFSRAKENAE